LGLSAVIYVKFRLIWNFPPELDFWTFTITCGAMGGALHASVTKFVSSILGPVTRFLTFDENVIEALGLRKVGLLTEDQYQEILQYQIKKRFLDNSQLPPKT